MEQPPDLIYQCWLDDVYDRSDLGKFWDYTGSVEGIQMILNVVGIFWNGADLINMMISLCMGDLEAAWWYGVCALPFIGEKLGAGGKWLTSSTRLGQAAEESKVLKGITLAYTVPAGKLDDFARYMRDVLDAGAGVQGDVIFLLGGKEVMDGGSTISFRICEEVSGEIYEDVWRMSDESSWLLWEMPSENDVSYSGKKWRDFFEAKYGKENVQGSFFNEINYRPTSGVELIPTEGKTTTILGRYDMDTQYIFQETGNIKSLSYDGRESGFNLLNIPDELSNAPNVNFWNDYNVPFLDEAIGRNDIFLLATKPDFNSMHRINKSTGQYELSGFGKEIEYLLNKGYQFDEGLMQMVPCSIK